MRNRIQETIRVRVISVGFTVLALAVFKPFGLDMYRWSAYIHLLIICILGIGVCMVTEVILKYLVGMPRSYDDGVSYIIRRNLWFQIINTPLVSLMICLYRHFMMSENMKENLLSWGNFFETLVIIAFCSFAIGLYWRFKFRSKYLALELEETKTLNEHLKAMQKAAELRAKEAETQQAYPPETNTTTSTQNNSQTPKEKENHPLSTIVLTGTTSEKVTVRVTDLLYIEAVGNYVKVYYINNGKVQSHMLRATSKQIENDLSPYPMIVRCHRAFLVNLGQVEKVVSKSGSMLLHIKHCDESIPVSRSNMTQVKEAIKGDL